ncbi:MAG: sensor histidine kinase [Ktedonobacterales bacterium]
MTFVRELSSARWLTLAAPSLLAAIVAALVVGLGVSLAASRLANSSRALTWSLDLIPLACVAAMLGAAPLIGRLRRALDDAEIRRAEVEAHSRQLVAAVVHDLRAPLSALVAMSAAIADGAVTDPATLRRYQRDIGAEALQLTSLVEELFAQAQVASAPATSQRALTNLAALVALASEAAHGRAQRMGVTLVWRADGVIPPVFADAGEISRVLDRLLQNAIRHTPAGGAVLIRLTTATAANGAAETLIQVIDTGEGIPRTRLTSVFVAPGRYHTLPVRGADAAARPIEDVEGDQEATHPASAGVGFGLPLAAHVVRAHGGRIWAESPLPPDLRTLIDASVRTTRSGDPATEYVGTVVNIAFPTSR